MWKLRTLIHVQIGVFVQVRGACLGSILAPELLGSLSAARLQLEGSRNLL